MAAGEERPTLLSEFHKQTMPTHSTTQHIGLWAVLEDLPEAFASLTAWMVQGLQGCTVLQGCQDRSQICESREKSQAADFYLLARGIGSSLPSAQL